MCSGSSGGGLPQGAKNFAGGPTMGTQPVQSYGSNASGTYSMDPSQMQTGGADPQPTNGPRLPPILPPSAGPAAGGAGWGPQTYGGSRGGHNWAGIPGEGGDARNARMTAEVNAAMAQRQAEGMARRQDAQARRQQVSPMGDDGQMRTSPMDRMAGAFPGGFAQVQSGSNVMQQAPGTLPYGIPTDPAAQQAFIQAGNFTPDQVRTLRQMGQQVGNINTQGMAPQIQTAQQQNLGLLNTATQGYAPSQGMNPFFTMPR